MRRLVTIVSLLLAAAACSESTSPPPIRPTAVRPVTANDVEVLLSCERPLRELIERDTLEWDEFAQLVGYVDSHDKLEEVIQARGMYYPDKGTERYRRVIAAEDYRAALETHNKRYGDCDKLAMYVAPFLINMPNVTDVTIIQCAGDFTPDKSKPHETKHSVHAYVVFQEEGKWFYYNNLEHSRNSFDTMEEAAEAAAADTGFINPDMIKYKKRTLHKLDVWMSGCMTVFNPLR